MEQQAKNLVKELLNEMFNSTILTRKFNHNDGFTMRPEKVNTFSQKFYINFKIKTNELIFVYSFIEQFYTKDEFKPIVVEYLTEIGLITEQTNVIILTEIEHSELVID